MLWYARLASAVLILGATLNWIVAWGCSWISPPPSAALYFDYTPHEAPEWLCLAWQRPGAARVRSRPIGGLDANLVEGLKQLQEQFPQPHVPTWSRVRRPPADTDGVLLEDARGWPCLSLTARIRPSDYTRPSESGPRVSWGLVVGSHAQSLMQQGELRVLPLLPLWRGFLANSLLFATLLAIPILLRRFLRWHLGRCLRCGFPIGTSPVCTECGHAIRPQRAA
jgi:hypothetical protein